MDGYEQGSQSAYDGSIDVVKGVGLSSGGGCLTGGQGAAPKVDWVERALQCPPPITAPVAPTHAERVDH